MNWERIEGQWNQIKGQATSRWAKLSADDVKNVAGKKDRLIGIIQARYGVLKGEAEKQVEAWITKFVPSTNASAKDSGVAPPRSAGAMPPDDKPSS